MKMQEVTLHLPQETWEKARNLAAKQKMPLSSLLRQIIEEMVIEADKYALAEERQKLLMDSGFPFEFEDSVKWTREELHLRE